MSQTTPSGHSSTPEPHPEHHHDHSHQYPQHRSDRRVQPPRSKMAALIAYALGHRRPGEITIISHSNLFYWWPVWAVGFLMAGFTYFQGVHAGFVTGNPVVVKFEGEPKYIFLDEPGSDPKNYPTKNIEAIITDNKSEIVFPKTKYAGEFKHTWPMMSNSKNPGVIFSITLLLVITITNVPLRGVWSWVTIIVIVLMSIIFALAGWWDEILSRGRLLAVHMNLGAYVMLSLTLFIIWLVNFAFFDRRRYLIVTSGQIRLKLAVGEGEIAYDTTGMVFQKQRVDLFRHVMLGLGSGDLIVRPAGGKEPIDLPNVLFVGTKIRRSMDLIREREIVPA